MKITRLNKQAMYGMALVAAGCCNCCCCCCCCNCAIVVETASDTLKVE